MKTQEQLIATMAYDSLANYNYDKKEYVRIIRWLPSMLSQAGCDTTFEFLHVQVYRNARNKQVIGELCANIATLLDVPEVTEAEYNMYVSADNPRLAPSPDNAPDDLTHAIRVWRIQHHINGLSTDMYIQFVQRLYTVLVWLKRLAVAMQ